MATRRGSTGNDALSGTSGVDLLLGFAGNDRLFGRAGSDRLFGHDGNDLLYGHDGNDVLFGHNGNDRLFGHDGNDRLYGHNGNDQLFGHNGNDHLQGNNGNDLIQGQNGNDVLFGQNGRDRLFGQNGNDRLYGHNDADVLAGGNGKDRLDGGNGDDRLFGHADDDTLLGRNGDDVLVGHAGDDLLLGHAGDDVLSGGDGDDRLFGHAGDDRLRGGRHDDFLSGREGDDDLAGGDGDDALLGGDGDDTLAGGAGADVLDGGAGGDLLDGGGGPGDLLYGGPGDDVLVYRPGETAKADGGSGYDVLRVAGEAAVVDLRGATVVPSVDVSPEGAAAAAAAGAGTHDTGGQAGAVITVLVGGVARFLVAPEDLAAGGVLGLAGETVTFVANAPASADGAVVVDVPAGQTLVVDYGPETLSALVPPPGGPVFSDGAIVSVPAVPAATSRLVFSGSDDGATGLLLPAAAMRLPGTADAADAPPPDDPEPAPAGGPDLASLEAIDLTDGVTNTLRLDPALVAALPGEPWVDALEITGDAGDVVDAGPGWVWWSGPTDEFELDVEWPTTYRNGESSLRIAPGVELAGATEPATGTTLADGAFGNGALQIDLGTPQAGIATLLGWRDDQDIGGSFASGGDLNGDGLPDLVLRGTSEGFSTFVNGAAIVEGTSVVERDGYGTFAREFFSGEQGLFRPETPAFLGDFNGDGLDDLVLVDTRYDDAGNLFAFPVGITEETAVAVVSGEQHPQFLPGADADLQFNLENFSLTRPAAFGVPVGAGIGDTNGDGLDDLLFVDRAGLAWDGGAGQAAYVVYGHPESDSGPANLESLAADGHGYTLALTSNAVLSLPAVDGAGDFNGDGFGDFLVGAAAPSVFDEGIAGNAYLVLGQAASVDRDLAPDALAPGVLQFRGAEDRDGLGTSVAGIGDIDGDGLDDVAIAAPHSNPGGATSDHTGSVYVVYGLAGVTSGSVDLGNLGDLGFRLDGLNPGDYFGSMVSGAGDFNGDGYDDFAVGAWGVNRDADTPDSGAVYLLFGGPGRRVGAWGLDDLGAGEIVELAGSDTAAGVGRRFSAAGDVNGDGYDDLALDGGRGPDGAGSVHVLFGRADVGGEDATPRFEGGDSDDDLLGTANDEILIGGAGSDRLDGGAGNDVLRGALGDDVLVYDPDDSLAVDGGAGIDTLLFDGDGVVLDFDRLAHVANVERIDLRGGGADSLTFDVRDILALPDSAGVFHPHPAHQVLFDGDAGDALTSTGQGWVQGSDVGVDGVVYHAWHQFDLRAMVLVDPEIDTNFS